MKNHTLFKILVGLLIILVLFSVYRYFKCRSEFKLSLKNEKMSRDVFQDTVVPVESTGSFDLISFLTKYEIHFDLNKSGNDTIKYELDNISDTATTPKHTLKLNGNTISTNNAPSFFKLDNKNNTATTKLVFFPNKQSPSIKYTLNIKHYSFEYFDTESDDDASKLEIFDFSLGSIRNAVDWKNMDWGANKFSSATNIFDHYAHTFYTHFTNIKDPTDATYQKYFRDYSYINKDDTATKNLIKLKDIPTKSSTENPTILFYDDTTTDTNTPDSVFIGSIQEDNSSNDIFPNYVSLNRNKPDYKSAARYFDDRDDNLKTMFNEDKSHKDTSTLGKHFDDETLDSSDAGHGRNGTHIKEILYENKSVPYKFVNTSEPTDASLKPNQVIQDFKKDLNSDDLNYTLEQLPDNPLSFNIKVNSKKNDINLYYSDDKIKDDHLSMYPLSKGLMKDLILQGVALPLGKKLKVTYKKFRLKDNDADVANTVNGEVADGDKIYIPFDADDSGDKSITKEEIISTSNFIMDKYLYDKDINKITEATLDGLEYGNRPAGSAFSGNNKHASTSVNRGRILNMVPYILKYAIRNYFFYLDSIHNISYVTVGGIPTKINYEIDNIEAFSSEYYLEEGTTVSSVTSWNVKEKDYDTFKTTQFDVNIRNEGKNILSTSSSDYIIYYGDNNSHIIKIHIDSYNDINVLSSEFTNNNEYRLNETHKSVIQPHTRKNGYYISENQSFNFYFIKTTNKTSNNSYLIMYKTNTEVKFLKKIGDSFTFVTDFNNNEDDYTFNVFPYKTIDLFSNTLPKYPVKEKFDGHATQLDKFKFKPIIINKSLSQNTVENTLLIKYINGIYTKDRYLLLTPENTITNNIKELPILQSDTGGGVRLNNTKFVRNNPDFYKNHYVACTDTSCDPLQSVTFNKEKTPDAASTYDIKKTQTGIKFDVIKADGDSNNTYTISESESKEYLILRDSNNKILHCTYKKPTDDGDGFEFDFYPTIKSYSIYKQGILEESYSPFFIINSTEFDFHISDPTKHLVEHKIYEKQFKGNTYESDIVYSNKITDSENYYHEDYPYLTVKSIFDTKKYVSPFSKKSITTITMILDNTNDILTSFSEMDVNNIKYKFGTTDPNLKPTELYTFEYEEDVRNYPYFDSGINYETIEIKDYIKKETSIYKTKLIQQQDLLLALIKRLKDNKLAVEKKTSDLLILLKSNETSLNNTIDNTIMPIYRDVLNLINDIYNIDIEIGKIDYQRQNKIQFAFTIMNNKDAQNYVDNQTKIANNTLSVLNRKLEYEKTKNYSNTVLINKYIKTINNSIQEINKNLNTDHFQNTITNTNTNNNNNNNDNNNDNNNNTANANNEISTPSGSVLVNNIESNISAINKLQKTLYFDTQDDNEVGSRLNEPIMKLTKQIKILDNDKYKLLKEIELNENINDYYKILITIYKNTHVRMANAGNLPTSNLTTDELQSTSNYGEIVNNLVRSLYTIKIEKQENKKNKHTKLTDAKNELRRNNFKSAEFKINTPSLHLAELNLLNLQDAITNLNKQISNINTLKHVKKQLFKVEQIRIKTKNENINNYNVLEPFSNQKEPNKRFNSLQSHNDNFISVSPKEDGVEYKININGKCLASYGINDYELKDCENTQSQYFGERLIESSLLSQTINKDIVHNPANIEYPYHNMVSSVSNDCVTVNNDNITLETCTSNNKNQRFTLITDKLNCIDN